jgi:hypothetical protein
MELVVLCAVLAICCGFLLWDRSQQQGVGGAPERSPPPRETASALESQRRFLDAILNSIGDPNFVKDREHRCI